MSKEIVTKARDLVAAGTGVVAGSVVDTIGSRDHVNGSATFWANVTAISGVSATVVFTIIALIEGVDHTLATYTGITAVSQVSLTLADCPAKVRVESNVTGTTPSVTATVSCVRF